jgi:hypothetical protein
MCRTGGVHLAQFASDQFNFAEHMIERSLLDHPVKLGDALR